MSIMNIDFIKGLAGILDASNLTKIDISEAGAKIVLERSEKTTAILQNPASTEIAGTVTDSSEKDIINFNSMTEVKSPVVGVFYSASSPETNPFVSIGDTVKKGDVLCIIEAMKLLNEITAEQDGKIVDICLKNGDVVEFGQVLFKMV